jgi:hypothetical protein
MAKKQGVKVEPITQTHLNRYEGKIADTTQLPLKFRSLLAGASRLTRLQSQETSPDKQVIWDTTASAVAPMLFGFVHWCLVEAQKKGFKDYTLLPEMDRYCKKLLKLSVRIGDIQSTAATSMVLVKHGTCLLSKRLVNMS